MRAPLAALVFAAVWAPALAAQNADGVDVRASVSAETVYVGQQITYTLSVRIPAAVRQRLRRTPLFVAPEPRSMLAYDFPLTRVGGGAEAVEVYTFRRALFVLTPGRFTLGPARLSYAVPQSASFFSREDERTLRAEGVSFTAIEPPMRGRPASWAGAVGEWRASVRAQPTSTRVGDPFVFLLRLEGTGNATLLPRPALKVAWADVVPQDERVTLDSTPALMGGAKEFTWLVTPREAGAQSLPSVEYTVFNPSLRQYQVVRSEPLAVSVRPGTLVTVPPRAVARADSMPVALRQTLRGNSIVSLPWRVPLTWLALLAPLPWLLLRFGRRARRRGAASKAPPPRTTRALLEQALATRTGLDLSAYTSPGALTAALRLEGVTPETAAEVERLRDACDAQGFSAWRQAGAPLVASTTLADSLRARAMVALEKVDREARRRALLLCALLGSLAACVTPSESPEALQAFTEGRTAFAGGDYARARDAFLRAASLAPRDASAWANAGSAAWAARDTATAVYGWQRALRLDPTASDVRERLARIPAPQHRGAARVWPVSPLPLFAAGLGIWFLGWGVAFGAVRANRRARWAAALILPGALLVGAGAWLDAALAARDLVVLADSAPLRTLPALGADPGAMPITGEIARIVERRGVWVRLELDGNRGGWYPVERLRPLARD